MSAGGTVGRRAFLAAAGTVGMAGLAGCTGPRDGDPTPEEPPAVTHRQEGVLRPAPASTVLTAYDVTATDRAGLAAALRALSDPDGNATVLVAVGASLFDHRFGLSSPRRLVDMPEFRNDVLDPSWCHGDLLVQVSAETGEQVEAALARPVPGVRKRWRIAGFHPTGLGDGVRNLFGFREGAGNPDATDGDLMDRLVWVQPGAGEPSWCAGGCYQVVRLIRLAMPTWDSESAAEQERVFGVRKDTGLPLGQSGEHTELDYADDPHGSTIALDAHIRRANPRTPDSVAHRILRRGYAYRLSAEDAGHVFVCFQRDLELGFATIQRRLAGEALERYLLPFGGGYYFVLPGSAGGEDYLGRGMLEGS
ncbi:Dyp-type peroxidase [Amycolatopsis cihanbeyliensis]|uniref:Deferrochelatase/peroxidase EfeB n=1 Tax=Amycolatopsis cihanbeyliensis TaxID=1128664 RepID=A0A542DHU8_AMYCI|nr:Dyp-type peroxidase [Amycolatopsis cihanbeyliensis]TQJ02616.1 deferrochelatase/peroxidase EfeB [Amycolatopsis cihanbeyliensis]